MAEMKYAMIGDMRVSVVALGCFAFGGDHVTGSHLGEEFVKQHAGVWGDQPEEDTFATVKAALDAGINFFDTAESYGDGFSEKVTGRALKASGYARSSYYIATKVSEAHLSAAAVRAHVEASIARLDCEYIDILQLHWHSRAALKTETYPQRPLDAEIPLEETLSALKAMCDEGKVKHVGLCNFGVKDLAHALASGVPIVSNQLNYNLLWRGVEIELLPFCKEKGVAFLPWAPLASALLTGKFETADDVPLGRARSRLFCDVGAGKRSQARHGEPGLEKETFAAIAKFKEVAEQIGQPLANVALAWVRMQPGVTSTLMGARTPQQLERNLQSLALELPPPVLEQLAAAGDEVKRALGAANLDPYEGAASSRIR